MKSLSLFLVFFLLIPGGGTRLFASQEEWQALNLEIARLYAAGDVKSAVRTAEESLSRAKKEFGPSHLNTAKSLNNLANLYFTTGRVDEAGWMYEDALVIEERELGPESAAAADTLYNFSMLLMYRKDFVKAGERLERSLAIYKAQDPVDAKAVQRVENALTQLALEKAAS